MYRRLGERNRVASSDIGYNFRRGDDRSVAIGRESEIRSNVRIAVDSLVEIALTIQANRNITRRGF